MAKNIKLGAPQSIVGTANSNANLSVQVMERCKELTLDENATQEGSIVTALRLLKQLKNEMEATEEAEDMSIQYSESYTDDMLNGTSTQLSVEAEGIEMPAYWVIKEVKDITEGCEVSVSQNGVVSVTNGGYVYCVVKAVDWNDSTKFVTKMVVMLNLCAKYPALAPIIAEHPALAPIIAEYPDIAEVIVEYPDIAEVIVERPSIIDDANIYGVPLISIAKAISLDKTIRTVVPNQSNKEFLSGSNKELAFLFDNNESTSTDGASPQSWAIFDYGQVCLINRIGFLTWHNNGWFPNSWILYGSNDKNEWNILTKGGDLGYGKTWAYANFDNKDPYKYYKFETNASKNWYMYEIGLFFEKR